MLEVLLKLIPRCIFEPVAVLGIVGLVVLGVRHWKKDKAETILFSFSFLFMIAWRMIRPINSDRYALILIPIAIYGSVVALQEIAKLFGRRFHLPTARLLLGILLVVCLVKAFHSPPEEWEMFEMIRCLKTDAGDARCPVRVFSNHDVSCFLDDRFEVSCVFVHGNFYFSRLPDSDYYLLKLNHRREPLDADHPDFRNIKTIRRTGEKSYFMLLKREKHL